MGFCDSDDDPCIFYNKDRTIIIAILVDDGIVICKYETEVKKLLHYLANEFEIKVERPKDGILYYLEMEINFLNKGIFVSQAAYTKKILEKYGFEQAYSAVTQWNLE